MAKITRDDLFKQLQAALDQRSRDYDTIAGFAFRFSDDDLANSQNIMRMIGGTAPDSWSRRLWYRRNATWRRNFTERSTGLWTGVASYYWSYIMPATRLSSTMIFGRQKGKHISWHGVLSKATDSNIKRKLSFRHCFYTQLLLQRHCHWHRQPTRRIVEVIAAVNSTGTAFGNDPSNPRKQVRAYTSNLADHMALLKGRRDSQSLHSRWPLEKPTHKLILCP